MPKTTKAAPKPRKASPAPKRAATRKPAPRKVKVDIGLTPPELSDGKPARFDEAVRSPTTRPTPKKLADAAWLAQGEAYQVGYHLVTHGLSALGHPELELCNVPGPFVRTAYELLLHVAEYVTDGNAVAHGEVMKVTDEPMLGVIGFCEIAPGKGGTAHEAKVLRLVFAR